MSFYLKGFWALASVGLGLSSAQAQSYPIEYRFNVPNSAQIEICKVLARFPGVNYDDADEKTLCGYDFYNDPRLAICAKVQSTNPAVEVFEIKNGVDKESFIANSCKKEEGKKVGKFKQSMSCSHTPSILGYYHISKLFNGSGDVPPAVYRTMEFDQHQLIRQQGLKNADGTIKQIWGQFPTSRNQARTSKWKETVYTPDMNQLYGALSVNPRNEEKYSEMNGGLAQFKGSAALKLVTNAKPVADYIQRDMGGLQKLVQIKDVGDMLVMDYIMSQQDRYGNIHYTEYYYFWESGRLTRRSVPKKAADEEELKKKEGATKVKVMLMKDNDCGVAKTNVAKAEKFLEQVRHLDVNTYYTALWLNQNKSSDEIKNYFSSTLLFSRADMTKLTAHITEAAKILSDSCKAGRLNLDSDPEAFLRDQEIRDSRSYCELPSGFAPGTK